MRFLHFALLLLSAGTSYALEWVLYHPAGVDAAPLAQRVQPLLPQGVKLRLSALPAGCDSEQDARLHSEAIAAGINSLPALSLRDARGAYAALLLSGQSDDQLREQLAQVQDLASAPTRSADTHRRLLTGKLFELRFRLSRAASPAAQDTLLEHINTLMMAQDTPEDMRQLIALHCLYPAIMQQYAAEYQARGAHSPRTERKLLEAIRVLELARDTNKSTTLGRRAHAERERLRAARLKSRQYE